MFLSLSKFGYKMGQFFLPDLHLVCHFNELLKSFPFSSKLFFQEFLDNSGVYFLVVSPKELHSDVVALYRDFCIIRGIPPLFKEA